MNKHILYRKDSYQTGGAIPSSFVPFDVMAPVPQLPLDYIYKTSELVQKRADKTLDDIYNIKKAASDDLYGLFDGEKAYVDQYKSDMNNYINNLIIDPNANLADPMTKFKIDNQIQKYVNDPTIATIKGNNTRYEAIMKEQLAHKSAGTFNMANWAPIQAAIDAQHKASSISRFDPGTLTPYHDYQARLIDIGNLVKPTKTQVYGADGRVIYTKSETKLSPEQMTEVLNGVLSTKDRQQMDLDFAYNHPDGVYKYLEYDADNKTFIEKSGGKKEWIDREILGISRIFKRDDYSENYKGMVSDGTSSKGSKGSTTTKPSKPAVYGTTLKINTSPAQNPENYTLTGRENSIATIDKQIERLNKSLNTATSQGNTQEMGQYYNAIAKQKFDKYELEEGLKYVYIKTMGQIDPNTPIAGMENMSLDEIKRIANEGFLDDKNIVKAADFNASLPIYTGRRLQLAYNKVEDINLGKTTADEWLIRPFEPNEQETYDKNYQNFLLDRSTFYQKLQANLDDQKYEDSETGDAYVLTDKAKSNHLETVVRSQMHEGTQILYNPNGTKADTDLISHGPIDVIGLTYHPSLGQSIAFKSFQLGDDNKKTDRLSDWMLLPLDKDDDLIAELANNDRTTLMKMKAADLVREQRYHGVLPFYQDNVGFLNDDLNKTFKDKSQNPRSLEYTYSTKGEGYGPQYYVRVTGDKVEDWVKVGANLSDVADKFTEIQEDVFNNPTYSIEYYGDTDYSDAFKTQLADVIYSESGNNLYATNKISGAYGLPQFIFNEKIDGSDELVKQVIVNGVTNVYTKDMFKYGTFDNEGRQLSTPLEVQQLAIKQWYLASKDRVDKYNQQADQQGVTGYGFKLSLFLPVLLKHAIDHDGPATSMESFKNISPRSEYEKWNSSNNNKLEEAVKNGYTVGDFVKILMPNATH